MIYEILFEILIFTPITIQYSYTKTRKLGRIDRVELMFVLIKCSATARERCAKLYCDWIK